MIKTINKIALGVSIIIALFTVTSYLLLLLNNPPEVIMSFIARFILIPWMVLGAWYITLIPLIIGAGLAIWKGVRMYALWGMVYTIIWSFIYTNIYMMFFWPAG